MLSRRSFSLVFIGLLAPASGCVIYPYRAEVNYHQADPADNVQRLVVESQNGAIEVVCEPERKQIDIDATKYARGLTLDEARKFAEQIQIECGKSAVDSTVYRIATRLPDVDNRSRGVNFRVKLPQNAELDLDTSNGHVRASGTHSRVHIKTSNGRIEVTDVKGDLKAETSNGAVVVRDVGGNVDVESSNGSIDLTRVGKETVRAETSNGRIKVVDAKGEASVRSSNGAIELRLCSTTAAPRIDVTTSNGSVNVEVPSDVSARLNMATSLGRVKADLEHVGKVKDLEADDDALHATLNDGKGSIHIRSSLGSVNFRTVAAAK